MARTIPTDRPTRGEEESPRTTRARSAAAGAAKGGGRARGGESSGTASAPPTPPLRGDDKKLHSALVQFYVSIGMGAQGIAAMKGDIGLVAAGANIVSNAEAVADAWVELAQQNPKVRTMLQGFIQGSSVATLVGLHASMVVPMLGARNMVPPEVAGMFLSQQARETAAAFAAKQAAQQAATNNGRAAA